MEVWKCIQPPPPKTSPLSEKEKKEYRNSQRHNAREMINGGAIRTWAMQTDYFEEMLEYLNEKLKERNQQEELMFSIRIDINPAKKAGIIKIWKREKPNTSANVTTPQRTAL